MKKLIMIMMMGVFALNISAQQPRIPIKENHQITSSNHWPAPLNIRRPTYSLEVKVNDILHPKDVKHHFGVDAHVLRLSQMTKEAIDTMLARSSILVGVTSQSYTYDTGSVYVDIDIAVSSDGERITSQGAIYNSRRETTETYYISPAPDNIIEILKTEWNWVEKVLEVQEFVVISTWFLDENGSKYTRIFFVLP